MHVVENDDPLPQLWLHIESTGKTLKSHMAQRHQWMGWQSDEKNVIVKLILKPYKILWEHSGLCSAFHSTYISVTRKVC